LSTNKQDTVCCTIAIKQEKPSLFSLKIFTIFFHPSARVTAMGGAEKRFVEILKVFCRQNHVAITVLESAPGLLEKTEITCNKHLLSSSFHGKGWLNTYLEWVFWSTRAFLKSCSIISHEKPSVILLPNNTLPNLALGYIAGLVFRRPVCVIVHHVDTPSTKPELKDNSLYANYRRIDYGKTVSLIKMLMFYVTIPLLKRVKAIIAVSNFTAKTLQYNGVPRSKISVSGNAIDYNFINNVKPYSHERQFDGVFVGRIAKEKGVFDLLEVWKNIAKTRKNAKLLIIGSGLELDALKKKIAADGLRNNVLIRGRCSDEELYSLLKSSKLFVFPSLFEGWGIAVAEALACGLPVVACDIPALREIFGRCKSVFLVPVGDVEGMINAVLKVLGSENEGLCRISTDYARSFEWQWVALADLETIKKAVIENSTESFDLRKIKKKEEVLM